MTHKMKIDDAKKYIADKLDIDVEQLSDAVFMTDLRDELGIGTQEPFVTDANYGMEAKFNISDKLGMKINSVERFKDRAGIAKTELMV